MRFVTATAALLLGGCASAPETHGRWYIGVAIVVGACLIGLGLEALCRRAARHTVDETDEAAC